MNIKNNDFLGDFLQFKTEKIKTLKVNMQILNQTRSFTQNFAQQPQKFYNTKSS